MTVGETLKGTVDALKTNPSTFAMIVMSFGLLGYTYYTGSSFNTERADIMRLVLSHQQETAAVLARCVEPSQVEIIIRQLEVNRTAYNQQVDRNYEATQQNHAELQQIIQLLKKPLEERQPQQ